MRARQRGLSIVFVAVLLLLAAGVTLGFLALTRTTADVDRSSETTAHLSRIQSALEQFASAAERLPCPANPAIDTGDAEPNAGSAACTYPAGTVPWRTIGLRREDSLDAWGWKIGYRVYQGATGLTQNGGASMVNCDTVEPTPAGTDANGRCRTTHNTTEAQFLAGKGLQVYDFSAVPVNDAAYVLISHGSSGLGAYTNAGVQKTPNPTSADESANLGSAGPFIAKASVTNVSAEDATHFDDVLAYRRLADFVKRANLAARDWPEPPVYADITFNSSTIAAATGSTPSPGSLGQPTISVPNATVTAFDSGGNQNLSFDNSAGTEGIGGANGGNLISSAASEGVRVVFSSKARQLALTFFDFGRLTGTPGNPREQVEVRFFDGATEVVPAMTKQGCKPDGGLATFSIDAGADFDRVEIKALPASNGTSPTNFLFVQVKTCDAASTCTTSLSTGSNTCP